jgi:hypothetical protein
MADKRREPSCILNHEAMHRELRDKGIAEQVCPSCGWTLRPAKPEEVPDIRLMADAVVTYAEAYGLEISAEANALWDIVERYATRLPSPFSVAEKDQTNLSKQKQ